MVISQPFWEPYNLILCSVRQMFALSICIFSSNLSKYSPLFIFHRFHQNFYEEKMKLIFMKALLFCWVDHRYSEDDACLEKNNAVKRKKASLDNSIVLDSLLPQSKWGFSVGKNLCRVCAINLWALAVALCFSLDCLRLCWQNGRENCSFC